MAHLKSLVVENNSGNITAPSNKQGTFALVSDITSAETRVQALIENEASTRESAINTEKEARENADNNLNANKEDKLNTAAGYSSSNNIVLVSIGGNIQWKPFNNILAGSSTPMSSEGNNGDIYIQTQ